MDILKNLFKNLTLTTETKKTKSKITRKTHKKNKESSTKKSSSKNKSKKNIVGGAINTSGRTYYIIASNRNGNPHRRINIGGNNYIVIGNNPVLVDEDGHRYYMLMQAEIVDINPFARNHHNIHTRAIPEIAHQRLYRAGTSDYYYFTFADANRHPTRNPQTHHPRPRYDRSAQTEHPRP